MSVTDLDWLEGYTVIGIIQKPHGVRGEMKVRPETFDPSRFKKLTQIYLGNPKSEEIRLENLESSRFHGETLLVRLESISTPEEVKLLQFQLLLIKEEDRLPMEEGYYYSDLEDLKVLDQNGEEKGKVLEVLEYPANEALVLKIKGKKILAPWIDDCVLEIDLDEEFVKIDFDFLDL